MPFIVIPVVHASGGWIASTAAGGYIAGTLSSTWIGALIAGNTALASGLAVITSSAAGAAAWFGF